MSEREEPNEQPERRREESADESSGQFTQQVRANQVAARVPEEVSSGVFASGVLVMQGNHEIVLDFVLSVARPHQVVARVVLPPTIVPNLIQALRQNLQNYEQKYGPPPEPPRPGQKQQQQEPQQEQPQPQQQGEGQAQQQEPQPQQQQQQPNIEEIYSQLKLPDRVLAGSYANTCLISHTFSEFCLDFIATFYPRSVVSSRVLLATPQVPRIVDSLSRSFEQYQRKIAERRRQAQQQSSGQEGEADSEPRSDDESGPEASRPSRRSGHASLRNAVPGRSSTDEGSGGFPTRAICVTLNSLRSLVPERDMTPRSSLPRSCRGRDALVVALGTALVLLATVAVPDTALGFRGWEGLRVVREKGSPDRLRAADVDGDGREELFVVNPRQARVEQFDWLPPEKREERRASEGRPNELPMAPELERSALALEQLPRDALLRDVRGDDTPELLVLLAAPDKVALYERADDGKASAAAWSRRTTWALLSGSFTSQNRRMLYRPAEEGPRSLLISFKQGIQRLSLSPDARPSWLKPRTGEGRKDWWLLDPDGDGDRDLMEWFPKGKQIIRWYETRKGRLLPPRPLYDQTARDVEAIHGHPDELLILGDKKSSGLRRYRLARGENSRLGKRQALPLPGSNAPWAGIKLPKGRALVTSGADTPRLLVYRLGEEGWRPPRTFPIVSDVVDLAAVTAEPGTLLLRAEDASDLHVSRWKDGRFTYPEPMGLAKGKENRRILALATVGKTTWWAQKVGEHIDLYVWEPSKKEPSRTRFKGVGKKAKEVAWLGGHRFLLMEKYAKQPKLVVLEDGEPTVRQPSHLNNDLSVFELYAIGDERRPARLTKGVLQWLGEDLHPTDQVMLPEGQDLVSFVPEGSGRGWALQRGGRRVYRLRADDAGVFRVASSAKLPGGNGLTRDPILGLLLLRSKGLVRLASGRPWKLSLQQVLDSETGRASGVKQPKIHRLFTTDALPADGTEPILCDDRRHQLTLLERGEDGLSPALSWPVFEDRGYPYGGRTRTSW